MTTEKTTKTVSPDWQKLLSQHQYFNMCLITQLQQMAKTGGMFEIKDILDNCSNCSHFKASRQTAVVSCTIPYCSGYNELNCGFHARKPWQETVSA